MTKTVITTVILNKIVKGGWVCKNWFQGLLCKLKTFKIVEISEA